MFRKLLIANRGEIAIRIIRACRILGIIPVAVYSEVDRSSLHVRYAREAYCIGPAAPQESYLNIDAIIETAKKCGAEAIHPGYGFLSENQNFVRRCEEEGITFIGPPAASMEKLGPKTPARRLAMAAGVPVVPGTVEDLTDEAAKDAAIDIGLPVVIKAKDGGGGKGMRVVTDQSDLSSAIRTARSEAKSAFGSDSIYVEKYLSAPRHVEMQVLADGHDNFIYLGERECSVQRRHQKVIEEAPSPSVDLDLRRRMGEATIAIAKAAGYVNAGTAEFLMDKDKNFYFLEMNTRLQVEHPVTEMVTGLDLVKEQILIANGERLVHKQEDLHIKGSAIEARIYAEDPFRNFVPSPGKIETLRQPSGGGIRLDNGVYEGYEVPIYYDPLMAKLIAWGATRGEAITRMRRALWEYIIIGVPTTIPFHQQVMDDPQFQRGEIDTTFIDKRFPGAPVGRDRQLHHVAAVAAALHFQQTDRQAAPSPTSGERVNEWKMSGRRTQMGLLR